MKKRQNIEKEENTRPQSHSQDSYPTKIEIELSQLRKFALTGYALCLLHKGVASASKANISESTEFAKFISALRDLATGDNENFCKYIRKLDK